MYQLRRYFSCYILHRNKPKNIIVIMCKRTRKRSNHPSISYIIIWACKCEILQLCSEGIFTIYTIQFCASIPNCMCVLSQYVVCTLQSAIVQDWEVIVLIIIHDSHLDSPGRALFWFDSNIRSVNVNACTSIFFFSVHYCIPGDKRFGLVGDPSFIQLNSCLLK